MRNILRVDIVKRLPYDVKMIDYLFKNALHHTRIQTYYTANVCVCVMEWEREKIGRERLIEIAFAIHTRMSE